MRSHRGLFRATLAMGVAEVSHDPNAPEKRGLLERLRGQVDPEEEHGARVHGTPWISSPFLRWGALGVAFISFSALLGYSALPSDSEMNAAPALSFFAIYLTDAPLPGDLDGLVVSLARVGAGDPSHARALDLRVRTFDLSKHHGIGDALPVATGYVLPAERDSVFIEFDAAIGLRGDEEVPLEVSERFLHVEYEHNAKVSDRAAVLLDIDLERSVQEVDLGLGSEHVLRFVPLVGDVYEEALPDTPTSAGSGQPIEEMEPLFASAIPVPPLKQYRTSASPFLAAGEAAVEPLGAGPLDVGADDEPAGDAPPASGPPASTPSTSSDSSTPSRSTLTPTSSGSAATPSPEPPVNRPPQAPRSPAPGNGATGVQSRTLSWLGGDDPEQQAVTFEVFLGTTNPPPLMQATCETTQHSCTADHLATSTRYYWRVRVDDRAGGTTLGDVWSFTTASAMCQAVGVSTCPLT